MKKATGLLLVLVLTVAVLVTGIWMMDTATSAAKTPSIQVEKTDFAKGETIHVKLESLPDTLPASTYVILYPRTFTVGGTPNGTWVKITEDDGTYLYQEGDVIDVVKKDALTGQDFSLILVAPYMDGRPIYDQIDITIGKPSISVSKSKYGVGEAISVSYVNVEESLLASSNGGYVTIAIYKDGHAPGANSAQMEHRVWHNTATNASKLSAATISFPDAHTASGNPVFPLPVGDYYACIRHGSTVVLDRAEFSVCAPEISTEKTNYAVGEPIDISYERVTEYYLTAFNYGYVTIAVYKDGDKPGAQSAQLEHRVWHSTATNASELSDATIRFPDAYTGSGTPVFPLPAGKYYACVRQGNNVLARADFFVGAPEISVSKTQYEMGEDIEISYANVDENYLTTSNGGYVTIAVFKKDHAPGKQSAQLEHRVWHNTATNASKLSAATIIFPEAYTGSGTPVFPLSAGEYYACVRQGSSTVLARADFTVTEGAIRVAQPEIKDSITMHYTALVSDSLSDVKMKFIYDGQEEIMNGVAGETKNHCTTYMFALPNILPQQMGCNIRTELYAGDTLLDIHDDYSVKQYCINQLAQTSESDVKLRALLVAMLNYGTEAQKYFESAVDGFVNEGVDQSYLTNQDIANAQGVIANPISGDNTGDYVWKAATLGLYDEIKIRVKFYATSVENLKVLANDVAYTEFVRAGTDLYYVYIPVMASEFANALTIEFDCGEAVGAVLTYSVNTYIQYAANNGTADVQAIIQAIYNYGMAAKAYADTL